MRRTRLYLTSFVTFFTFDIEQRILSHIFVRLNQKFKNGDITFAILNTFFLR